MQENLEASASAFYRTAYLGNPAKAVEMYVGGEYIQHNPLVANGKLVRGSLTTMKSVSWDGKNIYPSKIVCIGRNYVDHIRELNNEIPEQPIIFLKPNSAISDEIYSGQSDVIHFEGEITFLVVSGGLGGVGFGIDLTKRELQTRLKAKGLPWERAKSFDKSSVFSKFVTFNGNIGKLRMELYINGKLAQFGGTDLMLHKPQQLLSEAQSFLSFEDGDLVMTGTPKGVGPVITGDKFVGRIFEEEKLIVEGTWVVN